MSKKKKKHRAKMNSPQVSNGSGNQGTAVAEPPSRRNPKVEEKMVTHLNTRFLMILASIFIAVGAGTYFLHDYQVKRNAYILKESAERSYAQGDSAEAIQLYSQYVRLAPDDLDAHARLGELIDQSPPTASSIRHAYNVYSELIREAPNRPDATQIRFRLAQLMMSLGEFSQAENQLTKLLKLPAKTAEDSDDPDDVDFDRAELLYLLGRCEAVQEKRPEALASVLSALMDTPQRAEYYEGAISLAQLLGRQIPERSQMEELLGKEPREVMSLPEELLAQFPAEPEKEIEVDTQAEEASAEGEQQPPQESTNDEQKQIADAQPLIDYLLVQIPAHVEPQFEGRLARARYFLGKGDFERVESELEKINENERDQPDVTLFEANYAFSKAGRLAEEEKTDEALAAISVAEQAARSGKQQDPHDLRYDLLLANAGLQRFQFETDAETSKSALEKTLKILKTAIEKLPESREAYQQLEDLDERDKKFLLANVLEVELRTQLIQTAITLLESDLFKTKEVNGQLASLLQDTEAKTREHGIEVIETLIEQLEELTRDNALLTFLKASKQYAQLQRKILDGPDVSEPDGLGWGAVADALRRARLLVNDRQTYRRSIDLMLNQYYQALNNDAARVALFREVFERDTNWGRGRLEYARALRDAGQDQEAIRQYVVVWQQFNVPASLPELVSMQIHNQQRLPKSQQEWGRIESLIGELRKSNPGRPELRLLDAEVKAQQDRFAEAAKLIDELLGLPGLKREDQIAAWQSRIAVQLQRDDQPGDQKLAVADEILSAARKSLGDTSELMIEELRIARARSAELFAEKAEMRLKSLENFSRDEQVTILEYLAATYDDLELPESELKVRRRLAELEPANLNYHLAVNRLATQLDNEQLFAQTLETIRAIEGEEGPEGNFQQASWFIRKYEQTKDRTTDRKHYGAAMKILDSLSEERPYWSRVPVAKGYLEGLGGDEDKKFALYRQAIDLGATQPQVLNPYLAYLIRERRESEERELISRIKQETPRSITPQMRRREQEFNIWEDRLDLLESNLKASFDISAKDKWELAKKVKYELSQGTLNLLKYRQLSVFRAEPDSRRLQQLFAEAEKHFLSAIEIGPQDRTVWTHAVVFYVATGNVAKAADITQQASEKLPADPPELKPLTLGACYRLMGDSARAKTQYELAVQAAPDDESVLRAAAIFAESIDDHETAQKHWQRIAELTKADAPSLAAQAEARLNYLNFLKSSTYAEALKSIRALEMSLPEETTSRRQNLVTQVQILQRFPVLDFQKKLVKVLEQMQELGRLPVPTQLTHITLYKTVGQNELAEQKLRELVDDHAESGDLLVRSYAAEFYANGGKIAEATEQLDRLRRSLTDSFVIMALEAKLAYADDDTKTKPAEIVQTYLAELPETQSAETVFLDSVCRHQASSAFTWLATSPGARDADAQNRIREATRRLQVGNLENAQRILKPLLERNDVQKLVYSTRIRECAALLEAFEIPGEAEQVYRRYLQVTDDENAPAHLISLLRKQGKVEEAIRQGEKIVNEKNSVVVIAGLLAVLRTQDVTPAQQQRVQAILDRAIGADRDSVPLLHLFADYQDFVGEYDIVEKTYLRIIGVSPKYSVAMNNLAWLLAIRDTNPMRSQQARRIIDQLIDLYGPTDLFLDTKATVEMSAGRFAEAVALLKRSIAAHPTGERYYRLSFAQLRAGQKDAALESYRKAFEEEGFDPANLHPLERDTFKQLQADLLVRN